MGSSDEQINENFNSNEEEDEFIRDVLSELGINLSISDFSQQYPSIPSMENIPECYDWDPTCVYKRETRSQANHRLEIMAYIFYHKVLADEVEDVESIGLATPKKGILKRPASCIEEDAPDTKKSKRVHFPPEKELETVMEVVSNPTTSTSSSRSGSPKEEKKTSEIPVFDYRIRSIFDRMKALFHNGLGKFGWDVEILQPTLRLDPATACTNQTLIQDLFSNTSEIAEGNDLILYRNENFDGYETDNDIDEFFNYYETPTADVGTQTGLDDAEDDDGTVSE